MKKIVNIVLILLIILAVPAVSIIVNKVKARQLRKNYPVLGEPVGSEKLVLVELDLKGKTIEYFHSNDEPGRLPDDTTLHDLEPARYWPKRGGLVHFDTLKNQFMVATTEYVKPANRSEGLLEEQKHVCYFDEQGRPAGHISRLYTIKQPWRANSVLLLDHIPNFPNWKNKKSELYLRHFEIGHLETAWLNPIRGMGSPNGAGPAPAWSGTGYYDLHVAGDTLRFRAPATKDGLMFLESRDFETDLAYCKFSTTAGRPLPAFLIHQPRFGQGRVFMIRRKS